MKVVIDTNVPKTANGKAAHVGKECELACIEYLQKIVSDKSKDKICIDNQNLIWDEYSNHLSFSGAPGVGDLFFKHVHNHYGIPSKVELVPITPIDDDESRSFEELPPNTFDRDDRKFLAVAVKSKATVINATDTDWHKDKAFIDSLRVKVKQLCPEHGCCTRS